MAAGPPASTTGTGRQALGTRAAQEARFCCPGMAKHRTRLYEKALPCTELGTTSSSGGKAEPEGKGVVLRDVYSGQKGELDFILKSMQKMQGSPRRGEENL